MNFNQSPGYKLPQGPIFSMYMQRRGTDLRCWFSLLETIQRLVKHHGKELDLVAIGGQQSSKRRKNTKIYNGPIYSYIIFDAHVSIWKKTPPHCK